MIDKIEHDESINPHHVRRRIDINAIHESHTRRRLSVFYCQIKKNA